MKKEITQLLNKLEDEGTTAKLLRVLVPMDAETRIDAKRVMLKAFTQVEKMKPAELVVAAAEYRNKQEADAASEKARKEREKEEDKWKTNRVAVVSAVREIRTKLSSFSDQLAGVTFDSVCYDAPNSMQTATETCPVELAESLNPFLSGLENRCAAMLPDQGSDDLSNFKYALADTAFAIGVLAGAMFNGASEREIDRLERGLIHATMARRGEHRL